MAIIEFRYSYCYSWLKVIHEDPLKHSKLMCPAPPPGGATK